MAGKAAPASRDADADVASAPQSLARLCPRVVKLARLVGQGHASVAVPPPPEGTVKTLPGQ